MSETEPICTACGEPTRTHRRFDEPCVTHPARPAGGEPREREARGKRNFDNLTMHAREAREALAKAHPPLPEDAGPFAALYYPLLFLTQTVEDTLRDVLRSAYEDLRPEIEAAGQWLAAVERAAEFPPDSRCITAPDGECVSEGDCMHTLPSGAAASPAGGPPGERERPMERIKAAIRADIDTGARLRVLRSPTDYADVACGAVDRAGRPEGGSDGE